MLLKKITSIFKYFKDFLIGIYIRSKNRKKNLNLFINFHTGKVVLQSPFLDLAQK